MLKYLHFLVVVLLVFISFLNFNPIVTTAASSTNKTIDLSVSPTNIFFNVKNIKPGDRVIKSLRIENTGDKHFEYSIRTDFIRGSKLFFNQLDTKMIKDDKTLFEGNLINLNLKKVSLLEANSKDTLTFIIEFPYESGNEFQGLATEFEIVITAEGDNSTVTPPGTPTSGDGELPQTGESNPLWYYLSGMMLTALGIGIMRQNLTKDRPRIRLKR